QSPRRKSPARRRASPGLVSAVGSTSARFHSRLLQHGALSLFAAQRAWPNASFRSTAKMEKIATPPPSLQDMLTLLRKNLCETSVSSMLDVNFAKNLTIYSKT